MDPPIETTQTVIVPLKLGAASKYEKHVFPLAYYNADDTVTKGSVLLSSTLDEILKIAKMGIDLNTDERFHFNARIQYEILAANEAKLQSRPKSFNPITKYRYYRAARVFHAAAKVFFSETMRTSEKIQRREKEQRLRAVPSTEVHVINDVSSQDGEVDGIAVELPGFLDDDTRRQLLAAANTIAQISANASDPFIDNPRVQQFRDDDSVVSLADTASLLSQGAPNSDTQTIEPMSPGSYNIFYFLNSIVTAGGSNVHGMSLNHGSGNGSGR